MYVIISIAIVLLALLYRYTTRNFDYWKKKNVLHDPPIPLFGNNFDVIFGRKSLTYNAVEIYNKSQNEKVFGYYRGCVPELYINDPDIIRDILSVDFSHLHHRGIGRNPKIEPLAFNLFTAEGDTWKLLRQRLTPAFTTAKLKNMYPLIVKCAEKLQVLVEKQIQKEGDVCDVRDLMARFTTEFIGVCGFGIDMDTINNENSLFREFGKIVFNPNFFVFVKMGLSHTFPEFSEYIYTEDRKIEDTIFEIVTKVCEQRNYKPCGRHDFIDLLLELRKNGSMKGQSLEKMDEDGKPVMVEKDFDHKMLVAQAFIFFIAGFETSSSASSYALHQLAFNPDVQSRVQEEIDRVLLKYDNKLCYDAVAEMSLLSMTLKESLRMSPPLGIINRVCVRKYTIPGINLTIDPGVKVAICPQAIHMDEKYYDKPEQFRPERFTQEEMETRHKFVYMPFGHGPRNCIGSRLGEMQALAGLAAFLYNFSVEPAECTKYKPGVEARPLVTMYKGGLPLKIKKRRS